MEEEEGEDVEGGRRGVGEERRTESERERRTADEDVMEEEEGEEEEEEGVIGCCCCRRLLAGVWYRGPDMMAGGGGVGKDTGLSGVKNDTTTVTEVGGVMRGDGVGWEEGRENAALLVGRHYWGRVERRVSSAESTTMPPTSHPNPLTSASSPLAITPSRCRRLPVRGRLVVLNVTTRPRPPHVSSVPQQRIPSRAAPSPLLIESSMAS